MDAGIADTLNRRLAQTICHALDVNDQALGALNDGDLKPWFHAPVSDTLMSEGVHRSADRAWLVGWLASRTPEAQFDGHPADCDWDNLYGHFRAEILARRDPQIPPGMTAQIRHAGVV